METRPTSLYGPLGGVYKVATVVDDFIDVTDLPPAREGPSARLEPNLGVSPRLGSQLLSTRA